MERNPITQQGYDQMVAVLKNLKEVVKPSIVRDIEEARAHGDISENSEYEDAKERQAHCEGRVIELENMVSSADVIDPLKMPRDGKIRFGTIVTIENTDTEVTRELAIVGVFEADVSQGFISIKSPMARALIGKEEGDEAVVQTPAGKTMWEVAEVRYK